MWIEHLSKSFGSIKTAIFYGRSRKLFPYDCLSDEEFPGDLKTSLKNDISQYRKTYSVPILGKSIHGFVENNLDDEFLKYNFQKMTSDLEFKGFRKIDNLGEYTKGLLKDGNLLDISKIENCMFPTAYVGAPSSNDTTYFKSARVDDRVVYFIEVPSDCGTIELYDSEGMKSFTDYQYASLVLGMKPEPEPAVVIRLGADINCSNNPKELYYEHDPRVFLDESNKDIFPESAYKYNLLREGNEISDVEYQKLQDETYSSGLLIITIGNNEEKSINLSYAAWINDSEPQRQQKRTTLRNRDYYGNLYKKDPTYVEGTNIIDWVSGNILGTKQVENTPLLNKKLERIETVGTEKYSPVKEYSVGDKVIYSGKTWISCYNNNICCFPQVSNKWVLESSVTDSLNDIVRVRTVTKLGASAENITKIEDRVFSVYVRDIQEGSKKDILIRCNVDHEIDTDNIYYVVNRKKVMLTLGSDFEYNDKTGILSLKLDGPNIQGLFGNSLMVGVRGITNKRVSFMVLFDGKLYTVDKWKETHGSDTLTIKKGGVEQDKYQGISAENGDQFSITTGSDYKNTYFMNSAEVYYGDDREFALSKDYESHGTAPITEGTLKIDTPASHTIYYINITQNICEVEITGGENFEVDEWYKRVPKNTSFELKIYPVEGSGIKSDGYSLLVGSSPLTNYKSENGIRTYTISATSGDKLTIKIIS